jgi:hypothetical protein
MSLSTSPAYLPAREFRREIVVGRHPHANWQNGFVCPCWRERNNSIPGRTALGTTSLTRASNCGRGGGRSSPHIPASIFRHPHPLSSWHQPSSCRPFFRQGFGIDARPPPSLPPPVHVTPIPAASSSSPAAAALVASSICDYAFVVQSQSREPVSKSGQRFQRPTAVIAVARGGRGGRRR